MRKAKRATYQHGFWLAPGYWTVLPVPVGTPKEVVDRAEDVARIEFKRILAELGCSYPPGCNEDMHYPLN